MSANAENVAPVNRARRYAHYFDVSPNVEWNVDRDVLRGRALDFSRSFLPDSLSLLDRLDFLSADDARRLSQVQGRTYAGMLGLVERFVGATTLLHGCDRALGDSTAVESLMRLASEELKHQELFRRLERMMSDGMPPGYIMVADPSKVASIVLGRSAWSFLARHCQVKLFARAHYEQAFEPRGELCPLFKDVFQFNSRDERQQELLDELEWTAEHTKLSDSKRDQAVADLVALLATLDGILQAQSQLDAHYFLARVAGRRYTSVQARHVKTTMIAAYRWQFIVSGMQHVHFRHLLTSMTTLGQYTQIMTALQPVMQA